MSTKSNKRSTNAASSGQKSQSKTSAGNSSATPNNKDKPSASRNTTTSKSATEMLAIAGKCLALAAGLTIASISFQEVLHPLYGSVPTSYHYRKVTLGAAMLSVPLGAFTGLSEQSALTAIASFLAAAPLSALWIGSWAARLGSAIWGPVLTQVFIAVPVWCLSTFLISKWMSSMSTDTSGNPAISPPAVAFQLWSLVHAFEPIMFGQIHTRIRPTTILINLSSVAGAACGISYVSYINNYTTITPSANSPRPPRTTWRSYIPLVIPVLLAQISKRTSPHLISNEPWTSRGGNVRVLARSDSMTGTVVVAENLINNFRFLRCDHSLLGGAWMPGSQGKIYSNGLGDSIYSAFVVQEAVRLVDRSSHSKSQENALAIGLGIGVAAGALEAHGTSVTVVEIDPAVYLYAREYFGLPEPTGGVFLEDARGWVDTRASTVQNGRYTEHTTTKEGTQEISKELFDYIVHDCFSGGSVPTMLFSNGFFGAIKKMLKDDGVLAVNFAGKVGSDPAHAILNTLLDVFPTCRVFHDKIVPPPGQEAPTDEHDDFLNMVFFCTSAPALTFRPPAESDMLESPLREHILSTMSQREVSFAEIRGNSTEPAGKPLPGVEGERRWVLTDGDGRLGEWQQGTALEHWSVMRHVMKDEIWEAY
ncbi:spermine/spermidine synthase [Ceratobasidium sp. AG-Ba]|nr:spermine/spermidine synthase [Ceratobasidium sp. AG-Ba]QRW12703.1 spermine/spermidine synthase [Ceratobasidium sp. AG-Ba]